MLVSIFNSIFKAKHSSLQNGKQKNGKRSSRKIINDRVTFVKYCSVQLDQILEARCRSGLFLMDFLFVKKN